MKLQLLNFKCHTNTTINLNTGVTLVEGESGAGKTTILDALEFVLYGKMRKVVAHNKKSCTVTLTVGDKLEITRQNGNNKLKLKHGNDYYEGEVAQSIIDEIYLKYTDFSAACYMKQGEKCPLLCGSNNDKMDIIRSISFKDDKAAIVQSRIKAEFKSTEAQAQSIISKATTSKALLDDFDKQHPSLKDVSDVVELMKVVEVDNMENLRKLIAETKTKLHDLRERLLEQTKKEEKLKTLQNIRFDSDITADTDRLKAIDEELKTLNENIIQVQKLKAEKAAFDKLQNVRKQRMNVISDLEQQITTLTQKMKTTNLDDIDKELATIKADIEREKQRSMLLSQFACTSYKELKEKYDNMARKIREAKGALNSLTSSLENIKHNELQKEIIICPECKVGLKLEEGKLHKAEGHISQPRTVEVPNVTSKMIEDKQKEVANIESEKERMMKTLSEIVKLNEASTNIPEEQQQLYDTYMQYKDVMVKLAKEKEELAKFEVPEAVEVEDNEEALRAKITDLEKERRAKQIALDKQQEKDKHAQQLAAALEEVGDITSADIKADIDACDKHLSTCNEVFEKCLKYERRCELAKEALENNNKAAQFNTRLQHLTLMYEMAKRVEKEILENTVAVINQQIARFLEILFPEDSISVIFKTTKDLKTKKVTKMECSVTIFYRNVTYDDPKQLSGGEYARLSLAMMLAINTITNAEFILLDESLSTLNSSLKIAIVDLLKELVKDDRICVVIEHSSVSGVYDHVINL